ncbi:MAG TPA: hypothetical protein VKT72_12890 [Candidatus Baltobacteraceae bacterium]|nr:hypothetical protein [Candidatus Baltobacteraceae bacterium]
MLQLLLAGIVLISGSQTISTTTTHNYPNAGGRGTVVRTRVVITHTTPQIPKTSLKTQAQKTQQSRQTTPTQKTN